MSFSKMVLTVRAFLIGVFMTTALTLSAGANQGVHGIMMVVKGDVKVISGQSKQPEAAKVGKKILPGDTITTGPDSRAKIVMSDKNVLNVSPDTQIVIEKYTNDGKDKNVELKVEFGKIRASVEQKYDGEKSKFNVKTPSAVAGVRGTDFLTSYDRGSKNSQIITFSGTVAVGKPGPGGAILNPVFVQPGQMTTAAEGKGPEQPKAMPKEEMKKANQESNAETAKGGPAAGGDGTKDGGQDKSTKEGEKDGKDKDKGGKDSASSDSKEGGDRKPASESGSMLDSNDLGTGPSGGGEMRSKDMRPPMIVVPNLPRAPVVTNPFLEGAVKGAGSKTTIIINKQ
jgi:hypothetical protein